MPSKNRKITPESMRLFAWASALVIKNSFVKALGSKQLRKALGVAAPPDPTKAISITPTAEPLEMLVGKSVRRAAKFLPGKYNCLSQAMAAQDMLHGLNRSSKIVIGFNANRRNERYDSHAWLITPNGVVVGGEIAADYTSVTVYSKEISKHESSSQGLVPDLADLLDVTRNALRKELGLTKGEPDMLRSTNLNLTLAKSHRILQAVGGHKQVVVDRELDFDYQGKWLMSEAMAGLKLVQESQQVSNLFRDNGLEHLIFKGVALASLSGRNLTARGAGDVDVLINWWDVPKAHRILGAAGFRPKVAFEPKEGTMWKFWAFRDRELGYVKDQLHLDLHWRVPKNESLAARTANQLARASVISLAGVNVPTLSPGDALVAAAVHNYLDFCQNLRGIIDIVHLANLENVMVEKDVPAAGKNLLSDTLEFVKQLLGEEFIPPIPGIPAASKKRVGYLWKLWEKNSVVPLVEANVNFRGGELFGRFEHTVKYGFSLKEVARFIAKVLLDFPNYQTNRYSTGVLGALIHRLGQLLTGSIPHLKARRESQKPRV
jgi:hypothetical protein